MCIKKSIQIILKTKMAITKNPIIRYHALDRCFSNPGRKYYIEDLIAACNEALIELNPNSSGVQKRQVQEDIKFMKESLTYEAPIESIKDESSRKHYYRYSDKDYSISNRPLNKEEEQHLKEALYTLTRFKGMPQFEWVEEMINRLKFGSKEDSQEIISFQENPELQGLAHFDKLYNAIANKQVLKIDYTPFGKKQISFEIHPYYLKQYNNRWFLFGMNHGYNQLSNLPLDRIDKIVDSGLRYIPNTEIDFEDFFFNTIGVSVPGNEEPQNVLLKVDKKLYPYLATKPIHHTQKVKIKEDAYTIISIKVHLNYELESQILARGEQIEVIEPLILREKIKQRIIELAKKY